MRLLETRSTYFTRSNGALDELWQLCFTSGKPCSEADNKSDFHSQVYNDSGVLIHG